jgi:diphthamide biosynthesis methyltransferase
LHYGLFAEYADKYTCRKKEKENETLLYFNAPPSLHASLRTLEQQQQKKSKEFHKKRVSLINIGDVNREERKKK